MISISEKRIKYIIPFAILYLIVAVCMFKSELGWTTRNYSVNLKEMDTKVSVEEFEKLRIGMTYNEVCEIVGGEGVKSRGTGNTSSGLTYYTWPGELNFKNAKMFSEVYVAFGNGSGRAEVIKEWNIIDDKEVYDNINSEKTAEIKKKSSELRNLIKEGVSYEQVVTIIGVDGVLEDSKSVVDINSGKKTEKEYVWNCKYNENQSGERMRVLFKNGKVDYAY